MDVETRADPDCEVLLEALHMHLETIRSRLVSLAEHFQSQADIPILDPPPKQPTPTPTVSPAAAPNLSERDTQSEMSQASCAPRLSRRTSTRERSSSSNTLSHPDTR